MAPGRLLSLHQEDKDEKSTRCTALDGDPEADPGDVLGLPDEAIAIDGTGQWDRREHDRKAVGELEQFVVEGCCLMRDRCRRQEVWQDRGFDVAESMRPVVQSEISRCSSRCCAAGSRRA